MDESDIGELVNAIEMGSDWNFDSAETPDNKSELVFYRGKCGLEEFLTIKFEMVKL